MSRSGGDEITIAMGVMVEVVTQVGVRVRKREQT